MAADNKTPAKTYTLEDFINMKYSDDITYRNLSILEVLDNVELIDHCLIDDYIDELTKISVKIDLTDEQYKRYRFSPDLLAYDVYGTVQADFLILFINDMIDPKEFDLKSVKLPYASMLKVVLNQIYSANAGYIEQNRSDNNIVSY